MINSICSGQGLFEVPRGHTNQLLAEWARSQLEGCIGAPLHLSGSAEGFAYAEVSRRGSHRGVSSSYDKSKA